MKVSTFFGESAGHHMVTKALASYPFCRLSEVIAGILEDHRVLKFWDYITSEEPSPNLHFIDSSFYKAYIF